MAPWLDAPGLSSALCSPLASCQLSAGAAALVAGEWRSIHALRKSTQGMAGDRAVPSLDGHQHRKAQHFLHIPIYTILKFLKDAMRARCHLLGLKIFLSVQSRRRSNDSVVALATLWMPKALRLWSGLSAKPWNLVTWRVARPRRPFGGRFWGMDWAWHGAIWNGRLRWKIDPSRVQHRNVDESKPISTYIHTYTHIYIYTYHICGGMDIHLPAILLLTSLLGFWSIAVAKCGHWQYWQCESSTQLTFQRWRWVMLQPTR